MNIWRLRIPTFFGLLILVGGLISGVYLVEKGAFRFLKAAPEITPSLVKITNLSENGFTVSWITDDEVVGFVQYGDSASLANSARDERDEISGTTAPYFTHYVKVSRLSPATKYFFKIGSGRKLFDQRGQLYEVTTAAALGTPPAADAAYGTVLQSEGTPASGAIVYLTLVRSVLLSSLTNSEGQWTIPLSVARTADLSSYVSYDPDASLEEIFVQGGNLGTSTAIANTKNDAPMPAITLGGNYDFRQPSTPTPAGGKFSLDSQKTPPELKEKNLIITSPEENEQIATQKPEIQGTGPAHQTIKIVIESPEILTAEVIIDELGRWRWTPPSGLAPGRHTITVTLKDETMMTRSFVVLAASGDFPAFTATPSGEITPSPTIVPTATPTVKPTSTPTVVPRKAIPATEEAAPAPGYLTPSIAFVILGLVLILTGLIFNKRPNFFDG